MLQQPLQEEAYPVEAIAKGDRGVEGGADLLRESCQPGSLAQIGQDQNWICQA